MKDIQKTEQLKPIKPHGLSMEFQYFYGDYDLDQI